MTEMCGMRKKELKKYRAFFIARGMQLSDEDIERTVDFLTTIYGLTELRIEREESVVWEMRRICEMLGLS